MKRWLPALAVLALGATWFWSQRRTMPLSEQVRHLPSSDGVLVIADGAVINKIAGPGGNEEQDYRDFVAKTGFDFRRDLERLAAVIGNTDSYYVVTGRFDYAKLSAYAGTCVKTVCSLPASQRDKWISFMPLGSNAIAIAVSPRQLAVADMEASRPPLVAWREVPMMIRGQGKHFSRFGLSGEEWVEANVSGDALELKAGAVTKRIPLSEIL